MIRRTAILLACVVVTHAAHALQAQQGPPNSGTFAFRDGRSRVFDVTVADVDGVPGIVWPELVNARWDTALLGVQINADAAVAAPYVEIGAGSASDRQYFPPGDAGERWLNVTFLRGAMVGTRISLRGEGVTVAAPAAKLRLFEGGIDLSRPVLVLAPHPDDAEIAAFGLYANRNASVVTVTAGNAGAPTYEAVFDDPGDLYLFKGRIRVIDSITIPWQGRIPPERTFNMGYFDARLAEMHDKRDAVIPEMYRPNADINVYRRENVGSLLPLAARVEVGQSRRRHAHLIEEGEARRHRRAAPAARHA